MALVNLSILQSRIVFALGLFLVGMFFMMGTAGIFGSNLSDLLIIGMFCSVFAVFLCATIMAISICCHWMQNKCKERECEFFIYIEKDFVIFVQMLLYVIWRSTTRYYLFVCIEENICAIDPSSDCIERLLSLPQIFNNSIFYIIVQPVEIQHWNSGVVSLILSTFVAKIQGEIDNLFLFLTVLCIGVVVEI